MKRKTVRTSESSRRKRAGKSRSRRSAPLGSSRSVDLDALVVTSAQAIGISLEPAWHEAIVFNLRLILHHAKLVDEFAVADDAEPASVFYA
jgi:hypothetical protein